MGNLAIPLRWFADWSGNCGNLSAAVGPFAIASGLIPAHRVPHDGRCTVRIWQANIGKTIIAHIPITAGAVQETGEFELDGVTFPAAEIQLEFLDPAEEGEGGAMFPTGNLVDVLDVPGVGSFPATLINAGIPTIFVNAADIGYTGTELQDAINGDAQALARFGHPSGTLRVGAEARQIDGQWTVTRVIMSRSARVLMEGWVRVPALPGL